jgi:hypothetical protein
MAQITLTATNANALRLKTAVLADGFVQNAGETDIAFVRRWFIEKAIKTVRDYEAIQAMNNTAEDPNLIT